MDSNTITGIVVFIAAIIIALWGKIFPAQQEGPAGGSGSGSGGSGSGSEENGGSGSGLPFEDLFDYPTVSAPDDVRRWYELARKWAQYRSLPWQIVLAVIWQESWGDPEEVGSSGEKGLMQVKQIAVDDVREFGYEVPDDWFHNPKSNIVAGTAYLALQYVRTGSIREMLKAYNQGEAGAKENPVLANNYADEVLSKAQKLGYFV